MAPSLRTNSEIKHRSEDLSKFAHWLSQQGYAPSTVTTLLSDARRVQAAYGNLDDEYSRDGLAGLKETLRYTRVDMAEGRPNPTKLNISSGREGNISKSIYNNLQAAMSAMKAFDRFQASSSESASLEKAIEIALSAHAGQVDKAGAPYILHPLRMMLRVSSPTEMMAAVLHDVVEDGPPEWTFGRLKAEGIPPEVVAAVTSLTKLPEEEGDYDSFIRRAARNPVARRVKLADLEDNMDLGRISNPTEKDYARIEKYRSAYAFLRSLAVDDQFDQPIEAGS